MKQCYVCGRKIKDNEFHYNVGPDRFVCDNDNCFNIYFWDDLAARMTHNIWHEYAIIDKKVYQIGSDDDEPRGFDGKYWAIQFNDGTYVETHSLWYKGELPDWLQDNFKDNAKFIAHQKGY